MAHLLIISLGLTRAVAGQIVACPLPPIYAPSTTFSLTADGKPIPIVEFSKQYDYAVFTLSSGPCQIEVTRLDGKSIKRQSVSPEKLRIAGTAVKSRLSFTIDKALYLIVAVDDLRKLVIAVDPPETDAPRPSGKSIYNVISDPYHADATGGSSSTAAIQKAIDDAGNDQDKHGIVYVPAGVFSVTELRLVSDVSLYLEPGAVLRCSGKKEDFHVRFHKDSKRQDGTWFIYTADGASNVRIFGRGTIDGDGKAMVERTNLLNHLVIPMNCSHFTMDGPVLRDASLWGTVVANSDHVALLNCKHFNHLDIGEDDCIDVCNSQDVVIDRSIAISLDDSYSCKTWGEGTDLTRTWAGPLKPNHNIRLENCFAWTRCFGFKIGAGVFQPQDDITIQNGVVYDAAHGIGISHSYGNADVHNVLFDSIDIERTTCNCLGRSWARFAIDSTRGPMDSGSVYDIQVRNINVRDAGTMASPIQGLNPQRTIQGVTFENVFMPGKSTAASTLAEIGVTDTRFASGIAIRN